MMAESNVVCLDYNQQGLIERLEILLVRAKKFEIKSALITYIETESGGINYEDAGHVDDHDALLISGMCVHHSSRFQALYDELTNPEEEEDEADACS